jgi:hypothetical protein
MADDDLVVYRIDAHDGLAFVNEEWDRFAVANGSGHLLSERILSRSLWDFVSDATTRQLYREMLIGVRAGRRLRFPFRCDSADCRRFLEMDARLIEDGAVEFQVRTLALEKRPPQAILDGGGERSGAFLRMCGWCKKVPHGEDWIEIEDAAAKLGLFDSASLPAISHGICEACEQRMMRTMADPETRSPQA